MKKVLVTILMLITAMLFNTNYKANAQTRTISIGQGNSTHYEFPFNAYYTNAYNQMIYHQHEIGEAGYIGAIAFQNASTVPCTLSDVTIWMALTSDSAMTTSSWTPKSALKQVFHATDLTIPANDEDFMIALDSAFYYDGTHHLSICVSHTQTQDQKTNKNLFKYTATSAYTCIKRFRDNAPAYSQHPGTIAANKANRRPNIRITMNTDNEFCLPVMGLQATIITENKIHINWLHQTENATFEVAIMDTLLGGDNLENANTFTVTDDSAVFNNLTSNTIYLIGVRKICQNGEYSNWSSFYVKTSPEPQPLPYQCNFENEASRLLWNFENGLQQNKWIINLTSNNGEANNYGLYISNNERDNAYTIRGKIGTVFAHCLLNFEETGEYNIAYDWRCMGDADEDFMRVLLVPVSEIGNLKAGTQLPNGLNYNNTPATMIVGDNGTGLSDKGNWQHFVGDFTITETGNYFLVYMWRNNGNWGDNPPASVDNIMIQRITCPRVENVAIDNITTNSAEISATSSSGNSFHLFYREMGTENYDSLIVQSPYIINNLKAGTRYEGLIHTYCGEGNESLADYPFTFGTECATITLPWSFDAETEFITERYESEKHPYCWVNINEASSEYYWRPKTGDDAHSGEQGLCFGGLSVVSRIHNDWMITPNIAFTGNDEMTFWAKTTSSNLGADYQGHFMLYVSTDEATSNNDTAHFIPLTITGENITNNTVNIVGNVWKQFTVTLPNTLIGNHYLAFAIKDIFSYDFCLDDISIYPATQCPTPQDIKAKTVRSDRATITWSGEAESYNVYYGEFGYETADGQMITTSDTSIELTNLTPQRIYECRIEAICGENQISILTNPITFHTTSAPIATTTLPYIENFSDNISGENEPLDNGWYKYTNNTNEHFPYIENTQGNGNPNSLYFENNFYYYSYAVLPEFEASYDDLVLSCSVHRGLYSKYNTFLVIGVMSNPRDYTTFTPYDTLFPSYQEDWTNFQISLSHFDSTKGNFIAFVNPMSNDYGYLYLDNIRIDKLGNCDCPTDPIARFVTDTTATLCWTDSISDSWTVFYGLKGFTENGEYDYLTVSENEITITNLHSQTEYEFYVKSNCDINDYSIPSKRKAFKTTCENINVLPYNENFESYRAGENESIHPCWVKRVMGNARKAYPYPSTESAIHGAKGLEFKAIESQSDKYNCYVAMPLFEEPITELKLKCNMRNSLYTNSSDFEYHSILALGVMSNPYDLTTFDTIQVYDMSDLPNESVWPIEHTFYNYEGDGQYIAFLAVDVTRGTLYSNENIFYIDDIIISKKPECIRPSNLTASHISDTSIQLSWEGNSSQYEVKYSQHADMSNSTVVISNADSIELTGLTTFTNYYINVRGLCEDQLTSEWMHESLQVLTTLDCGENFVNIIDSIGEASISSTTYSLNGESTHTNTCTWSIFTVDELHDMGLIGDSNIIRAIQLHANSVGSPLSFRVYMTSTPIRQFNPFEYDTIDCTKMTLVYDGSMQFVANHWNEIILQTPYLYNDSTNLMIAFERNQSISNNTEFYCTQYDNQVTINRHENSSSINRYRNDIKFNICTQLPSCIRPENVTATLSESTSIFLSWEGSSNNYQISYAPESFNPNDTTILPLITTYTNSYTLQNLIPNTLYTIYIRSICNNEYSIWTRGTKVRTTCAKTTLPITYDFEDAEVNNTKPVPSCFYRLNNADMESYQKYPFIDNDESYAHSGSQFLKFTISQYSGYPEQMAMVFPAIDTANYPIQNSQMSLWGRSAYAPTQIVAGIISDPNDILTFVPIDTITFNNQYTEYTIPFNSYIGNGEYPALLANRPRNNQNTYIDDVTFEEIPLCPRAYDLKVITSTDISATLSWTDTNHATQWMIDYIAQGSSDTINITVNTNPCTLDNLISNTKYFFNVRPICATGDIAPYAKQVGSFVTTQIPATLPYTYNFEDDTEWNQWGTQSNTSTHWNQGSAVSGQGSKSMYISNDNGAHFSTNWNAIVNAVAYRDINFGDDTSSFTLNFMAKAGGSSNSNSNALAVLLVNPCTEVIMDNGAPYTPWGEVNDIALFKLHHDTLWQNQVLYLENIAGVQRLVFLWYNMSTSDISTIINQAGAIDNISIAKQTCYRPNSLQTTHIESTSATLSWNHEGNLFQVAYIPTDSADTYLRDTIIHQDSLMLSQLEPNTQYTFQVRAICADGDTSGWSNPSHFQTICTRYLAYDTIHEDFSLIEGKSYNETGFIPDCWEAYTNKPNGITPHVVDRGTYWYAHNDKSLILTSGSGSYGNISAVRLPYIVEPINTLKLTLWMCTESNSRGTLEVGYLTNTDMENDFVAIATIEASDTTKYKDPAGNQSEASGYWDTIDFSSASDSAIAIAIRWVNNSSYYSVCIDDIKLYSNIICHTPTRLQSNVESTTASLTWNNTADLYQLRIRFAQNRFWSDSITLTDTSYTFTDLYSKSVYQVQLRALCDEYHYSEWITWDFTTDEAPCFTPTDLTASNIDYEKVTLSWNNVNPRSRCVVNLFNNVENQMDTLQGNTLTLTGLYANTTYKVAVKSLCFNNTTSDWSDTITFSTKACAKVENMVASQITEHSATLTWDKGEFSKWELIYGVNIDQDLQNAIELDSNSYTIENLDENTTYDVYLRGYCTENTFGPWSQKFSFTTLGETQGIDGIDANFQFNIYPNPTSNATTIQIKGIDGQLTVSIIDVNGSTLLNETFDCNSQCEKRLDVNHLHQGSYFVRILGNNINSVRKLIVR